MTTNSSESLSECLQILIEKLPDIKTTLPNEYHDETILQNKLLDAILDVVSCQLANHELADTVQDVISALHASLATIEIAASPPSEHSTHFYDRHNVKNNETKKQAGLSHRKKCFICKGPGCWSCNIFSKKRLRTYNDSKVLPQLVTALS